MEFAAAGTQAQQAQPGANVACIWRASSHQLVPAATDPAEIYGNAVITPEELPIARRPRYFLPVKIGLLIISFACMGAGIASIVWGATVEKNQGGLLLGMREIPFKMSTAVVFIGSFATSVSLVVLGIAARNWYPSLITFGLFVAWVLFGDLAVNSVMSPANLDVHDRALNWARMPSSTHTLIYQTYHCCGYDNMSTCDYPAIRHAVAVSSASVAALKSASSQSTGMQVLVKRTFSATPTETSPLSQATSTSAEGYSTTQESPAPTSFRLQRRAGEPLIHGSETIPQNGPGVPLPTETLVVVAPSPLPASDLTPSIASVTSDLPNCKAKVDPLIDIELNTIRKYHIAAAVLSGAQLALLAAFWCLLGKWKMARGLGRW